MGTSIVDDSCLQIHKQFQQLKAFSVRLAELMEHAAEELRTTGVCPSMELISALQNFRQMFRDLQTHLDCGSDESAVTESERMPASLDKLERDFEARIATHKALGYLDQLQYLSHREGESHPVLAVCNRARLAALDAVHGMDGNSLNIVQAINAGDHPLSALWTLLNDQETLNDDEWTELLERVAEHLGRDVATALARHKLFIPTAEGTAEAELLVSQKS